MTKAKMIKLQKHITEIQSKLKIATDETSLALLSTQMADDYPEWRKELGERVLEYIVSLDLALASVHQERQRLLQSQLDNLAMIN